MLLENNLSSVALCVVNTERKGYPREAAVHIALRTVRRFMESHPGLTVVFCCETSVDRDIYARLMRWGSSLVQVCLSINGPSSSASIHGS
jgi:O-acetyl-ADP-ribose deacetylase (regulator of RNase III)